MKLPLRMVLVFGVIVILVSAGLAASNNSNSIKGVSAQVSISAEALKGAVFTDLYIQLPPGVTAIKKIHVKVYYTNGSIKFTRNYDAIDPVNDLITIPFDDMERGERVDVRVQTSPYGWLDASTTVLLRPDLVISSVNADSQVLVGETLLVNTSLTENNTDTGANATVVLVKDGIELDQVNVNVGPGSTTATILSTLFTARGQYDLNVIVRDAVPDEYDGTNNGYPAFTVLAVAPDVSVSNVISPGEVKPGEIFEVLATVSELYNEVNTSITLALLENGNVLDEKTVEVPAGGSEKISLNGSLDVIGIYHPVVRIISSTPLDANPQNNEQSFTINVVKPMEPVSFTGKYYYQNVSMNKSQSIIYTNYEDTNDELELTAREIFSFSVSSTTAITYPVDRIYFNITNESGFGYTYEELGITPTDGNEFTKYYPDNNVFLTFSINADGISMIIESNASSSYRHSRGYLNWWFKEMDQWDETTTSSEGTFLHARESINSRIEISDGLEQLGGSTLINITNTSSTNGWTKTEEGGWFKLQTASSAFNGAGSGVTQ